MRKNSLLCTISVFNVLLTIVNALSASGGGSTVLYEISGSDLVILSVTTPGWFGVTFDGKSFHSAGGLGFHCDATIAVLTTSVAGEFSHLPKESLKPINPGGMANCNQGFRLPLSTFGSDTNWKVASGPGDAFANKHNASGSMVIVSEDGDTDAVAEPLSSSSILAIVSSAFAALTTSYVLCTSATRKPRPQSNDIGSVTTASTHYKAPLQTVPPSAVVYQRNGVFPQSIPPRQVLMGQNTPFMTAPLNAATYAQYNAPANAVAPPQYGAPGYAGVLSPLGVVQQYGDPRQAYLQMHQRSFPAIEPVVQFRRSLPNRRASLVEQLSKFRRSKKRRPSSDPRPYLRDDSFVMASPQGSFESIDELAKSLKPMSKEDLLKSLKVFEGRSGYFRNSDSDVKARPQRSDPALNGSGRQQSKKNVQMEQRLTTQAATALKDGSREKRGGQASNSNGSQQKQGGQASSSNGSQQKQGGPNGNSNGSRQKQGGPNGNSKGSRQKQGGPNGNSNGSRQKQGGPNGNSNGSREKQGGQNDNSKDKANGTKEALVKDNPPGTESAVGTAAARRKKIEQKGNKKVQRQQSRPKTPPPLPPRPTNSLQKKEYLAQQPSKMSSSQPVQDIQDRKISPGKQPEMKNVTFENKSGLPVASRSQTPWRKTRDPVTQRVYFFNKDTRETSWKPPPGMTY